MSGDQQDILNLLKEREAAIARADAASAVAPKAKDAVAYELPPPLEFRGSGAPEIDALNKWFATWDGSVSSELPEPTIFVDGDLAVVYGLGRMRGVKKDSGPVDIWDRRTIVLQRRGGIWQIIHEHISYPIKMDGSFEAAIDLKP